MSANRQSRLGFTLTELLVVVALIGVMASLAIAFLPSASNLMAESRGGTYVQSWLNVAKQRALRDQAPRGVRLIVGTATFGGTTISNVVTDCQYLEQPEDFTGGTIASAAASPLTAPCQLPAVPPYAAPSNLNTIAFTNVDLFNGYQPTDPSYFWETQGLLDAGTGDCLEILGTGLMHTIIKVGLKDTSGNYYPNLVYIDPPLPYPITATANYRILRAPRTVGDETLKLPEGVVIDVGTNVTFNNALPPQNGPNIDIMFAPSGTVISRGVGLAPLNLWVRAPSQTTPANVFYGRPTVVSIYVLTGFVAANDAGNSAAPYAFVQ